MSTSKTAAHPASAPTSDEPDDLLFIDEVSTWTRIPVSTLRYYRRCGGGPHSAIIAKKIRYRRADVAAWLEAQFEGTEAGPVGDAV